MWPLTSLGVVSRLETRQEQGELSNFLLEAESSLSSHCDGTEWQPGHLALQGGPCPVLALLAARGLRVEKALEEAELQHPGEDDDAALGHRPPVDVVVVGLQEEGVGPFPHPGEVVEAPHVEGVDLQPLDAHLQERQSCTESCPRGSVLDSAAAQPEQMPCSVSWAGCAHPRCAGAPSSLPDPHPNCLQGVIQLLPLCWLLVFHVEVLVVHTKVEIHLHEAEVVLLVVQAELVETCRGEGRRLLVSGWKGTRQTHPQCSTLILPTEEQSALWEALARQAQSCRRGWGDLCPW